jgi:hypothetical protein
MVYPRVRARHRAASNGNGSAHVAAPQNGTAKNGAAKNGAAKPAPSAAPAAPRAFEPHYPAGASPFAALRPTPARASSFSNGLGEKLTAFASRAGNGRWPNLPRAGVAARLQALARQPHLVYQDGINACGPAIATYLFAKHQTAKFVDYAISLYDNGQGSFGSITVKGDGLFDLKPLEWRSELGANAAGEIRSGLQLNEWLLDWMLLAALRRSEDRAHNAVVKFEGRPDDGASGITWPGEMERWLRDGVGFARVTEETSVVRNKSLDHVRGLRPSASRIVVLLINVTVLEGGKKKSKSKGIGDSVQRAFPNHYCELEQAIASDTSPVLVWTWGETGYPLPALSEKEKWEEGYFGAFTCERT